VNPGHDGAIVAVRDGTVLFSIEAEHDSCPRHLPANAYFLLEGMQKIGQVPDVIATSGWDEGFPFQSASTPYAGVADQLTKAREGSICGRKAIFFESTHERSHIFCAYGMSPFPQGEPCYVLVWEGAIGSFYEVGSDMSIVQHGPVLASPGYKYSFLFDLADPACKLGTEKLDTAGKLMALAAFSKRTSPTPQEQSVIARILKDVRPPVTNKNLFKDTPYLNCGVTNPAFQDLISVFSEALFTVFYSFAQQHLKKGYPLLIAGGCGLNCEWNSRWRDCGLFSEVFVPPVANDSGSAIGTAIEAQYAFSGRAKVSWTVYSGAEFIWETEAEGFVERALDYGAVADLLHRGHVIAWVQGRSEIGPRALGNRSLLASPFERSNRDRLNTIKQREWYRPIAPVCLEEDAGSIFGLDRESPFMLYFQPACREDLQAVKHVDGSARVQTINAGQNKALHELLLAFKARTGAGVLCNTSLNRKGRGFINRSSELFSFAREKGLDAVVVNSRSFLPLAQANDVKARALAGRM
jgi:predicted NodU family carbamoyl transferase